MPQTPDRRRAERIQFAFRVRVDVTSEGILIDLSEGGARLLLSRPQEAGKQVTLAIESSAGTVHLTARVVRSHGLPMETDSATLARKEYQVAVEFLDPHGETAAAVCQLMTHQ